MTETEYDLGADTMTEEAELAREQENTFEMETETDKEISEGNADEENTVKKMVGWQVNDTVNDIATEQIYIMRLVLRE